jgi:hypothetical protein
MAAVPPPGNLSTRLLPRKNQYRKKIRKNLFMPDFDFADFTLFTDQTDDFTPKKIFDIE